MSLQPFFGQEDLLIPNVVGSHNTTTTKSLVAASTAGKKNKVYGLLISTLVASAQTVRLTDGSGGTTIWEEELHGTTNPQAILSFSQLPYAKTADDTALHLKLSASTKITYSFLVVQGD